MTGADLGEWEMFEHLHGPILIHERIDLAMASIATAVYRSHGVKVELAETMPRWDGRRDLPDEERLLANIRSLMKPKKEE